MTSQQGPSKDIDALASRPNMPGSYGLAASAEGLLLSWSWVEERMSASRNYWAGTVGADGRPHVTPVWGMWLERAFFFSTDVSSRKASNLARSPNIAVHLESGDEVVILEGVVERVAGSGLLERFADAYKVKYDFRPDLTDSTVASYKLVP